MSEHTHTGRQRERKHPKTDVSFLHLLMEGGCRRRERDELMGRERGVSPVALRGDQTPPSSSSSGVDVFVLQLQSCSSSSCSLCSCRRTPPSGQVSSLLFFLLLLKTTRSPPLLLLFFFFPRSHNAHFLSAAAANQRAACGLEPAPCSLWSCQSQRTYRAECECSRELISRTLNTHSAASWSHKMLLRRLCCCF